ncbi:MAG: hypothetical protein JSV52_12630 [Candidatus Zixiibacteriota bacterium]|nr:MAG: hypothetical protein JSV52_12630 [candidate division Zixibacteria bacterium]
MPNNSNLAPALVVGLEVNGLGITRALARSKIPSIGFSTPSWHPSWWTNSCRLVSATAWTKEAVVEDLVRVGSALPKKAPILITKDETVMWVSEEREQLSRHYEINLPDDDVVNLLMDKQKFTELALAEGWPVPKTWFVNSREDLTSSLKEMVYPCILKPAVKNEEFRAKAPDKAWRVSSEKELIQVYEMVAQWEKEVVIQEWIEGGDDRVAYCLTYYNRDSRPLALYAGRKLRQWPIDCGVTALAEPAPKKWAGDLIDLTDTIFRKVGYRGLGSIEYKMRLGSDEPVIMEPTVGRTNKQNEIAVVNGQNIPAIAYFDLIGSGYYPACTNLKPVKLVDGWAEPRAAWLYFRDGRLSIPRWLADWRGKKRFMRLRLSDPGPYTALIYRNVRGVVRRIVRLLTGRK